VPAPNLKVVGAPVLVLVGVRVPVRFLATNLKVVGAPVPAPILKAVRDLVTVQVHITVPVKVGSVYIAFQVNMEAVGVQVHPNPVIPIAAGVPALLIKKILYILIYF
jgi:hypothetical protein